MKATRLSFVLLAAAFLPLLERTPVFAADLVPPIITNLVSVQRSGTFFVDITYDLIDPDSTAVYISVEGSADGGATYQLPTFFVSGDVGLVTPGRGKKIVWNAWNDWAGNYTTNAKVRIIADDSDSARASAPTNAPAPNLAWIPAGAFNMSGTLVNLTKSFWMGKYEVTQAEFEQVMTNNPSVFSGPKLPVDSVSWNVAVLYCQRLTDREQAAGRIPMNWAYRLPTEAEWEYACRAGTTTKYNFGEDLARLGNFAWYVPPGYTTGNSGGKPHAVGGKAPNKWGLYDMYGNVWEWCSDWYDALQDGGVTDPTGPSTGTVRVIRGGGYEYDAFFVPSSGARCCLDPSLTAREGYDIYTSRLGFRVVLAQTQ